MSSGPFSRCRPWGASPAPGPRVFRYRAERGSGCTIKRKLGVELAVRNDDPTLENDGEERLSFESVTSLVRGGIRRKDGRSMVLVLDRHQQPLMPCSEKRTRLLLARGRAVVHKQFPFTIRLKDRTAEASAFQDLRPKTRPWQQNHRRRHPARRCTRRPGSGRWSTSRQSICG